MGISRGSQKCCGCWGSIPRPLGI